MEHDLRRNSLDVPKGQTIWPITSLRDQRSIVLSLPHRDQAAAGDVLEPLAALVGEPTSRVPDTGEDSRCPAPEAHLGRDPRP